MNDKQYVVIVAGGNGTRMGASVPKQFLLLQGKPILMHTIQRFYNYNKAINIVVTLPVVEVERWQQLCAEHNFSVQHSIVNGGETRFHSVKNALDTINEESLIAIHDGVRPLVSDDTIKHCFNEAQQSGAAIPVIECPESIRRITGNSSIAVDRSLYRLVQTPQIFRSGILLKAYRQAYLPLFTDDASVVEHDGHHISLVEGNNENIKITTPRDLLIADKLLSMQAI